MSGELKHWRDLLAGWNHQAHFTFDGVKIALLVGILEELRTLSRVIGCKNTIRIPNYLKRQLDELIAQRKLLERADRRRRRRARRKR